MALGRSAVTFSIFLIVLVFFLVLRVGQELVAAESAATRPARQAPTYILFYGGVDGWNGSEYTQYLQFKRWRQWAEKAGGQQASRSVLPIFSDGARSDGEDVFTEVSEKGASAGDQERLPNVRMWDPKVGRAQFFHVKVKNNFGPAEFPTVENAFKVAGQNGGPVFLFIGDHGLEFSPDVWDDDQKKGFQLLNLSGVVKERESFAIGWHGAKKPDDLSWEKRRVNGRSPSAVSTSDIRNLRQAHAPNSRLKFVATQCFAGGFGWLAFDDTRERLRGDTCGIMATSYYHPSMGCDPDVGAKYGYGYWVSVGLENRVDLDGDGATSLLDLHFYAYANDTESVTPQLTTEMFLQEKGYLAWPMDAHRDLREKRDRLEFANMAVRLRRETQQASVCPVASHEGGASAQQQIQESIWAINLSPDALENRLKNVAEEQALAKKGKPRESGPGDDDLPAERAFKRYREYREAELEFISNATEGELQKYMDVKACEGEALKP